MFSLFQMQEKQIFAGNIMVVLCCAFYLTWWLLVFRPAGENDGAKTNMLLIPAVLAGLVGVFLILRGINTVTSGKQLVPGGFIIWGGVATLIVMLFVTTLLLKRPVTTELFLICGWGMLALSEINALFRLGLFPSGMSVGFFVLICAAVLAALIFYMLYYRLSSLAGFITGAIPLILVILVMIIISCFIAIKNHT
jgi:hypothetical protein